MTSGAVSLWVAGDEQAGRAAARVRDLGHTVTVLGAGFLVALVISWGFEMTPEGMKRTEDVALRTPSSSKFP